MRKEYEDGKVLDKREFEERRLAGEAMGKDTRLINIYLKIHNKRALTLGDLNYLAQYDPECFEKTCKNVVYNIPETKPIMEPDIPEPLRDKNNPNPAGDKNNPAAKPETESFDWQSIEQVLENLKHLEMHDFPVVNIDADKVKSLLGNLYMEMLFPHNDKYPYMYLEDNDKKSSFDKKA